jgi:hypothetical protein
MGRRPLLTWLSAIVAALLALTLSGSALPPRTLTVLQLNLCHSGIASCFSHGSVQRAAELIRAYAPDVVALNEICSGDVNELARVFPRGTVATGFQSAPDRRTRTATLCVNGQQFGMGLILRTAGPTAGSDSIVDGGIYAAQDLNDPEIRAWLCVSAGRTACTGHLASTSVPIAQQQCRELIGAVRVRHAILSGDLNLREGQVRPCVPRDFLWTGDRDVQYVGASGWGRLVSRLVVDMAGTTDHPALLVVLRTPASFTNPPVH